MAYVILSRITSIDQLFLKEFEQKKIYCNKDAKDEVAKLNAKALNLQTTKWDQPDEGCLRLSSLNTRSLQQHRQDLETDQFVMKSDIILVQETWLDEDLKSNISDYHHYYVHGRSKGICTLTRVLPTHHISNQTTYCSYIKISFKTFDIINIYRFGSNSNIRDFTTEVLLLLDCTRTQVVAGDLNIDLLKNPNNYFTQSMADRGFRQLVTEPTHNQGGLIDHVYFHKAEGASCELFSNHTMFWSDHTCQSFMLTTTNNRYTIILTNISNIIILIYIEVRTLISIDNCPPGPDCS